MRQKRPLSGIIMEESAKSKLLSDSTDFLKSERWYASRGIPWKRGRLQPIINPYLRLIRYLAQVTCSMAHLELAKAPLSLP